MSVRVENTGNVSWADEVPDGVIPPAVALRATRLVAHWIPITLDPADDGSMPAPVAVDPVVITRAPLDPRRALQVQAPLFAPGQPGRWALVVDVTDDVDGSFAAGGSPPTVVIVDVVADDGGSAAN